MNNHNDQPVEQQSSAAEPIYIKPTKSNKKLFVSLGVVMVIVALLFTTVYGKDLYLNSSPKNLYFLAEAKTAKQPGWIKTHFGSELALQKKLESTPSTTKTDITAGFTFSGMDYEDEVAHFQRILKDSKLSVETVQDPTQQLLQSTISYFLKGDHLLDVNYIANKKSTGVEVPALFEGMLYINNDEFGEFMRSIDPDYDGPEDLSYLTNMKTTSLDEIAKQQQLSKPYIQFIQDNLKDEYFTLTKNVSYSTLDEIKNVRQIDLIIGEDETKKLVIDLIEMLRTDKELQEWIAKEYIRLLENNGAGPSLGYMMDEKYLIRLMADGLSELKKAVNQFEFHNGFRMTVLIDHNELIIDRKLNLEIVEPKENVGAAIQLKTNDWQTKDGNSSETFDLVLSSIDDPTNKIAFTYQSSGIKEKDREKQDILAAFIVEDSLGQEVNFNLDLKAISNTSKKGIIDTYYEFEFLIGGYEFSEDEPKITGTLKRGIDQNSDKNYSKLHYEFDMNMSSNSYYHNGRDTIGINFEVEYETTFDKSIVVPDIKENAINVRDMDQWEWEDLGWEIADRLESIFSKYIN